MGDARMIVESIESVDAAALSRSTLVSIVEVTSDTSRLAGRWLCERTTPGRCGWYGPAQDQRAGAGPGLLWSWREPDGVTRPPGAVKGGDREDAKLTWRERPWCPRCGSRAVEWRGELPKGGVWLLDGPDCADGLQPEERPTAEQLAALVADLDARLRALEGGGR